MTSKFIDKGFKIFVLKFPWNSLDCPKEYWMSDVWHGSNWCSDEWLLTLEPIFAYINLTKMLFIFNLIPFKRDLLLFNPKSQQFSSSAFVRQQTDTKRNDTTSFGTQSSYSYHIFLPFSAMIVRFITRRFIGEYESNSERMYHFSTIVDNELVQYEILDATCQQNVSNSNNLMFFCLSLSVFIWKQIGMNDGIDFIHSFQFRIVWPSCMNLFVLWFHNESFLKWLNHSIFMFELFFYSCTLFEIKCLRIRVGTSIYVNND